MAETVEIDLNGKRRIRLAAKHAAPIPAMTGIALRLAAGEYLKLTDFGGKQPADFWAFNQADVDECLSNEHTRVWVNRLCPKPGESFHTNRRRPILQLVADTCGMHDLLTAACDEHRYRLYGVQGDHPNCAGNLKKAMRGLGHDIVHVPSPVNFFTHVRIGEDGSLETQTPPSKPGDHVVLKAWIDCTVAISACPQEFNPIAGWYPTDLHAAVLVPAG